MFNCIAPEICEIINRSRNLITEYNQTNMINYERKLSILHDLLGSIGNNVKIDVPFHCDYGINTYIGNNVVININCRYI